MCVCAVVVLFLFLFIAGPINSRVAAVCALPARGILGVGQRRNTIYLNSVPIYLQHDYYRIVYLKKKVTEEYLFFYVRK